MNHKDNRLIILFGILLIAPTISLFLGIGKGLELNENRNLATLPKIGVYKDFPTSFTNYFNDNFGLRKWMIAADRYWRYKIFNVSPNKSVTIGKENWLFYTPDIHYIDTVNAQPFSINDLDQIKNNLLGVQNEFKTKGIKFYFLVAPNKQAIYPEYLPDYMKKVRPDSRLDQLSSYLSDFKEINFINPKKELEEMKKTSPVYLKYDTHWNDMGAFVANQKLGQMLSQNFPAIKINSISDFDVIEKEAVNKDLIEVQMGINGSFKETELAFKTKDVKFKIVEETCPNIYKTCHLSIRETKNSKLPKLVMFRDSFGNKLIPFISEYFQRSYYYWGEVPYPTSIIEKEKPDIVIMEITERELWKLKDKLFEF